ncbi:MAG: TIGR02679 domain-containing protein [Sedimentibacter sp.]
MSDVLLAECVSYFKSNKAYKRIFSKVKEKYISIGTFGGTIKLDNITDEEKSALINLLGQKVYLNKSNIIKVNDLAESFRDTKFEDVDFYDFLCLYFGEQIRIKRDLKEDDRIKREIFFEKLKNCTDENIYNFVVDIFSSKSSGSYNLISGKFNNDGVGDILLEELIYLNRIISKTEGESKIRLAILASETTNNPHALDETTFLNKILTYYLCKKSGAKIPANAEEKNALLYENNILKDDLSNNTLVAGVYAYSYDGNILNGHEGWNSLSDRYEPFAMSLVNLNKLHILKPLNKKVIILENPTVFMKYYELLSKENTKFTLICSNGQINLSTLMILDMLSKNDCKFYYSGDFDPEGLLIADKLLERYKDKIEPLFYNADNYYSALSNETVSDKRLKQLDKIKDARLKVIAECIRKEKRTAYQESLCQLF